MAEELTGEQAFNLVLREAIDSGVNAEKMRLRANELEHQSRTDRQDKDRAYSRLNDLERQNKEALPKLAELYAQAEQALVTAEHATLIGQEQRDKLRKALRDASDHCDQIPF